MWMAVMTAGIYWSPVQISTDESALIALGSAPPIS